MNKDIYMKNLRALGETLPDYESGNVLDFEETAAGRVTIKYNSRYIHSRYDPEAEAEKLVSGLNIRQRTVIFCFGLGLGYHVAKIIPRLGEENLLVIAEPSLDIFLDVIKNYDISDILSNKKISLCVSSDMSLYTGINDLKLTSAVGAALIALPSYKDLFPDKYRDFLAEYRDSTTHALVSLNTQLSYRSHWNETFWRNFAFLPHSHSFTNFKNVFEGRTCVVVAAGPSLDKNIKLLKEIEGKVPIICVYTAYRPLVKNNIKPDFIVSCDAFQNRLEKDWGDTSALDVPLLYFSITQTEFLKSHKGKKIFMLVDAFPAASHAFKTLGLSLETLNGGGSVTHMAMDFARYAGFANIIFIGLDLAFYGDTTHADGTYYSNAGINNNNNNDRFYKTPCIDGGYVHTTPPFYGFLIWIEMYIEAYRHVRYIDATEGGALIKGTEIMTFREAIDKYCRGADSFSGIMDASFNKARLFDNGALARTAALFNEILETLDIFKRIADEALAACDAVTKIYERGGSGLNKYLNILDKLDLEIKSHEKIIGFFDFIISGELMELQLEEKAEHESDDLYIMRRNKSAYEAIKKCAEESRGSIEYGIAGLKAALEAGG